MKISYLLSLLFCLCFQFSNAQVTNDSCLSAIDLGSIIGGSNLVHCGDGSLQIVGQDSTNLAQVNFPYPTIPNPCTGYTTSIAAPAKDVWYKFQANCDVEFQLEYSDTVHATFWVGDTCSNLFPLACFTNLPGNTLYQNFGTIGANKIYLQFSGPSVTSNTHFTFCLAGSLPGCSVIYDLTNPTPVTTGINTLNPNEKENPFNIFYDSESSSILIQKPDNLTSPAYIALYDLSGKLIFETTLDPTDFNKRIAIDVKGLFLLKLNSKNFQHTRIIATY